ncbi:lysophospholipid acyltransferase family protein [Pigmentibacter ruber]|uniref:lysophospholipid acyltransferase family protein n=1 Tax=Pigmentibacter ruber TaxID=2683196 RepID=UPI00131C02FD|nr:lysophospholipid acyltransferase family protein [Pigmentibacter ruber]BFD33247.1 lysophospholipid acyltransferase family protein [Pigmentibacter ruber]
MLEKENSKSTAQIIQTTDKEIYKSPAIVSYSEQRLFFQKTISFLLLIPFCYSIIFIFKFIMKYKIENIKKIRKQFKEIIKEDKPLIICANHLTFIDSCLIIWALAPNYWYQFNYKYFSWNLPAGDFFGKKWHYRTIAFLAKCIFIHRDASSSHHNEILSICKNLLLKGEIITIFPEGKRSRTGRFEENQMTYGVGKIIQNVPNCRVLCIYVRGDKQETYSNYPLKNSNFYIDLKLIEPNTKLEGREGCGEIVSQIAKQIKTQENAYFTIYKSGFIK